MDLVFLYDAEGETDRGRANHEVFATAARRLIALLAEITEEGFVFRVDMRLRPYGDSGPLVASFASLEGYFVPQRRPGERCAWLEARARTASAAELRPHGGTCF